MIPFVTMEPLAHPSLAHGFFGRAGGTSHGIYASLNFGLGSRDDPQKVLENRERVRAALGARELLTLYQIHSADVVAVTEPWTPDTQPKADAMVTDRPGIALGILTADCGPVLFADADAGVIGAAHAGWGGAVRGVLEHTLTAMERIGAQRGRIRAALGPCIAQKSYEVGPEFRAHLLESNDANDRFFTNTPFSNAGEFIIPPLKNGHSLFDLAGYIQARLHAAGVSHISASGHDTCAEASAYFSYRRATLRNEPDYGRQVSVIMLR